jgi:hypothetical protein
VCFEGFRFGGMFHGCVKQNRLGNLEADEAEYLSLSSVGAVETLWLFIFEEKDLWKHY